ADRRLRGASVAKTNRIVRILPALVDEAKRRGTLVLDQAITIRVAIAEDPLERGPEMLLVLADELEISGAVPILRENHHEERCRVHGPVIGETRHEMTRAEKARR